MTTSEIGTDRALVIELFRRFGAGDIDGALELLGADFVSHNPRVPHDPETRTGKAAFADFFATPAGRKLAAAKTVVHRIIAEGGLVAIHSQLVLAGGDMAVVDILRVENGAVVEHWDVVQPVPEPLPHPHGMF
ncbi:nuclear transport factor 2 family protein [Nocardia arthritidis]|uniref:SnoaL-like domain-containing protein n=1 Tax=Nocardia arthritidis TaxID=228602 RepID=A0A6G9YEX7_9NOCA|nr:nuclear transport factor 2 family protein [Nocardia arthritidis]QIS11738.1 hypothetical protein F5544_19350 [Nocardia arthritidis]